jgi:hypothetical protein
MAYGLVLFCVPDAYTILAAWIGAKLAASWQRLPVETYEDGRRVRAGTLVALMAGIVSVALGALAALAVRWLSVRLV